MASGVGNRGVGEDVGGTGVGVKVAVGLAVAVGGICSETEVAGRVASGGKVGERVAVGDAVGFAEVDRAKFEVGLETSRVAVAGDDGDPAETVASDWLMP